MHLVINYARLTFSISREFPGNKCLDRQFQFVALEAKAQLTRNPFSRGEAAAVNRPKMLGWSTSTRQNVLGPELLIQRSRQGALSERSRIKTRSLTKSAITVGWPEIAEKCAVSSPAIAEHVPSAGNREMHRQLA